MRHLKNVRRVHLALPTAPKSFCGSEGVRVFHDHRAAFLYARHIPFFVPHSFSLRMDDHLDDSFSDVDSDIFSTRSATSSATSHDVSMRSGSPAPSVYSVTSSLRAASYRHEYGRGLNNYSEVYQLPADDEELDRLGTAFVKLLPNYPRLSFADLQHEMFKKVMGAYPPPMAEVMADDSHDTWETKSVLDLGCGSGSWYGCFFPLFLALLKLFPCSRIMEVARDFPHCQAVAVDLVPMQSV
jgi:hypothetical protein